MPKRHMGSVKALISADRIDCILRDGLSETGPVDLRFQQYLLRKPLSLVYRAG